MKRFIPLFSVLTLGGSVAWGGSVPGKNAVGMERTQTIKRTLSSILTVQPPTLLADGLRRRLVEDLNKPIALGGKIPSAGMAGNEAAWEAYETVDEARLVDRFVQQSGKQLLLVTVTICYAKADGHMIYMETRSEPVTLSDTPAGHPLKL